MRNAISVAFVLAAAILAVTALATPDDAAPSWMLLCGVVILTSLMIAIHASAAARQAGLASAVAVLFPVLAENGRTITGVINWFGVYPHAYAAAVITALLCFAVGSTREIGMLRPATAVALVTTGSVLGLVDRRERVLLLVAFMALPLVTHIPGFAKLRPPFLLIYAVLEPLLIVAVLWAFVPSLRTATFRLTLMEFEFLTAVMPSGVMLIMGGAALRHRALTEAPTDSTGDSEART